jgi:hypothetical protein
MKSGQKRKLNSHGLKLFAVSNLNHIGTPLKTLSFCYERSLRRQASFHKFAVIHSLLITYEALPSICKSSFSRRNRFLEVPIGFLGISGVFVFRFLAVSRFRRVFALQAHDEKSFAQPSPMPRRVNITDPLCAGAVKRRRNAPRPTCAARGRPVPERRFRRKAPTSPARGRRSEPCTSRRGRRRSASCRS